ncbi:MAG: hypothetical protein BWX66_01595 [Deltaproteobacteria bacterium ADurb.Bin058]|nr:MAG: hypothetical protein BWX66_01595 [Deltaproteobacteria bacterium ADurb.Bin058]
MAVRRIVEDGSERSGKILAVLFGALMLSSDFKTVRRVFSLGLERPAKARSTKVGSPLASLLENCSQVMNSPAAKGTRQPKVVFGGSS